MGENYLPREEYSRIAKEYSKIKENIEKGNPNTASAEITAVLYDLDRIKLEEKNPEKIEAIQNLIEHFERLDKAIQGYIKGHKNRNKVLIRKKIETIDRILEKAT